MDGMRGRIFIRIHTLGIVGNHFLFLLSFSLSFFSFFSAGSQIHSFIDSFIHTHHLIN